MDKRRKVLLVSPSGFGGIQSLCYDISLSFYDKGYAVTILWEHHNSNYKNVINTPDHISIINLNTSINFNQSHLIKRYKQIISKYDIVYPNTSGLAYLSSALLGEKRPLVIGACYSNTGHDYENLIKYQDYYDKCILSNNWQRDYFEKNVKHENVSKYKVIRHGISDTDDIPLDKDISGPVRLLMVGRMDKNKRPFIALDLLKKLLVNSANVSLTYIGSGDLKEKLEGKVKNENLSDKVRFLSNIEQKKIKEEYYNSHFLLLPSITEAFGLVAIEAMQYGCVPIVTDSCGVSEVIQNKINGFILSKEKYIEEGYNIIISLINNKAEYPLISNNCIKEIKANLSFKKYIDSLLDLMDQADNEYQRNIKNLSVLKYKPKGLLDKSFIPGWVTYSIRKLKN